MIARVRLFATPSPLSAKTSALGEPFIRVFAGLHPEEVAGLVLVDPTQEELIEWDKARKSEPDPPSRNRPGDEIDSAPATFVQAKENPVPNIPVFLISGQGPRAIPSFVSEKMRLEVEENQNEFFPVKLAIYEEWLRQFPKSRLIVTERSGHGIPFEEPELVVETIRQIIAETTH